MICKGIKSSTIEVHFIWSFMLFFSAWWIINGFMVWVRHRGVWVNCLYRVRFNHLALITSGKRGVEWIDWLTDRKRPPFMIYTRNRADESMFVHHSSFRLYLLWLWVIWGLVIVSKQLCLITDKKMCLNRSKLRIQVLVVSLHCLYQ